MVVYFASLTVVIVAEEVNNPNGGGQGEWYFPNGNSVEIRGTRYGDIFYRNRGTRLVRLNRVGNPPERGRFRCEVPNAAGVMVTMYVNIGEWFNYIFMNRG